MINGKQQNTGRFLFNVKKDSKHDLFDRIKKSLDEFCKWYSSFNNRNPIEKISLYTTDFSCKNDCNLPIDTKISIIGVLIDEKDVERILKDIAAQYELAVADPLEF